MRLRLMATYLGVPYQAGLGPGGTEATLFSPGPPPEELGFTAAAGHWRKQVNLTDLDALWQSRPVGDYRGEPCLVLDDLGDRLHIAYLGRDAARAAQLGYWEIDREVFEVVVARAEVTGLTEEQVAFPLTAAMFPTDERERFGAEVGGPALAVSGPAAPNGFGTPNGYLGPPEKAGSEAYHETALNGGPPGNGLLAGYPGPDHPSRMPDRMTAWHGSPEPWPGSRAVPEDQPADRADRSEHADHAGLGADAVTADLTDFAVTADLAGLAGLGEDAADVAAGPGGPRRKLRPEQWPEPWTEDEPGPEPWTEDEPWSDPWTEREPGSEPQTPPVPGRRRPGRKDRIAPESVFAELLSLAAIPQTAYAVDEEVPGAMCLVEAEDGFEVFSRTDDARLDVHFFEDEEAAYFYLFGVLAAEAIRSGRLGPNGLGRANGYHNGSGSAPSQAAAENVSKYLRGRKLPNSASHRARVYLAGGADGPPLPKQPRRPPEAQVD